MISLLRCAFTSNRVFIWKFVKKFSTKNIFFKQTKKTSKISSQKYIWKFANPAVKLRETFQFTITSCVASPENSSNDVQKSDSETEQFGLLGNSAAAGCPDDYNFMWHDENGINPNTNYSNFSTLEGLAFKAFKFPSRNGFKYSLWIVFMCSYLFYSTNSRNVTKMSKKCNSPGIFSSVFRRIFSKICKKWQNVTVRKWVLYSILDVQIFEKLLHFWL